MGILRRLFGRKYTPSWDMPDASVEEIAATSSTDSTDDGVYTGTAAIVIYDLESLQHRMNDDIDWWASPAEEISELNDRNLLIVGLGSDGFYDIDVSYDEREQSFSL
jgi:hypothetical protein